MAWRTRTCRLRNAVRSAGRWPAGARAAGPHPAPASRRRTSRRAGGAPNDAQLAGTSRQAGFTLAGVLVLLTVIMVFIAYTVPRQWSEVMGRERDQEAIFAMKQYARAILTWQQKHGGLPTSLDQLKQARTPRVLRGSGDLVDPITGKMDWQLIPPTAIGTPNNAGPFGLGNNVPTPGSPPNPTTATNGTNPQGTPTGQPAAPKDYVGPFVGVRPAKTGKAYVILNGAENYEQWSYTIQDLTAEINARQAAIVTSK